VLEQKFPQHASAHMEQNTSFITNGLQ